MFPVFIACYRIAKCIIEITRGSVMRRYLKANDLIFDRMNTLYNGSYYKGTQVSTRNYLRLRDQTLHPYVQKYIYNICFFRP